MNLSADNYADEGMRLLRTTDIGEDGRLVANTGVFVSDEFVEERHRLEAGDLLFSRAGSLGRCFQVPPDSGAMTFAGYLVRFRPRSGTVSAFIEYCAASHVFQQGIEADAITSTISNFNAERYARLVLPDRSADEQQAIVDFLDTETSRIDALIAKKHRLIDLLEERRRSQTDALLGAERRVALRRVAELLPGYMFSSSVFGPDAAGPRLLRGVNVAVGAIRWEDAVQLDIDCPVPHRYRLAVDDVVVGMDRPFIAGGTRVARVDETSSGALLVQRVCRVRAPTRDAAILVEHVLRSTAFVAHVEPDLTGVSVPHLSDEQIGSMLVPVISGPELEAVATRLLEINARSELLARRLSRQITLLQEHRQALITAVVTGSLDVPGVAA